MVNFGRTMNIRYDKIKEGRYIRTITVGGKIINLPGNLQLVKASKKSDLKKDFDKYLRSRQFKKKRRKRR